ncbi:hypothetical protein, partial [Mesorhizobium japonicum]|uniref:hypothetical protein n=1 Tax=Mesorhizobium japonicum TaxID=2066070 RepID=UPI003B5B41E8
GNAYYPTEVGRPHGALRGRDLFGEQLAAAHRRGIRVIAYFSNMWDTAAAGAHPEWRLVPIASRAAGSRRLQEGGTAMDHLVTGIETIREAAPRVIVPMLSSAAALLVAAGTISALVPSALPAALALLAAAVAAPVVAALVSARADSR